MKNLLSLVTGLSLVLITASPVLAFTALPVPSTGAYFGLWATDAAGNFRDENFTALEKSLNKHAAIHPVGWNDASNCSSAQTDILKGIDTKFNAIPMAHINNINRTLEEIANNKINPKDKRSNYTTAPDDYWKSCAKAFKAYGKPMFLRIFSEMDWNGPSDTLKYRVCNSCIDPDTEKVQTPDMLIAAWKHVHDVFAAEGATNVMFTWIQIPNKYNFTLDYTDLYPGSAYVDWVGWDVYNSSQGGDFHSFSDLLSDDYAKMEKLAPGKPMIIPEFNSYSDSTAGTQRAKWFTDMLTTDLPTKFTNIKAINLFNVAFSDKFPVVQTQPAVLSALKTALASPYYISKVNLIPGDFNGDGKVNFDDFTFIKDNFLKSFFTIFDYNNLVTNFGK